MKKIYKNSRIGPSFSIRNRLARLLWSTVYITLFRTSPRPAHAWRAFLLRLFGAKIGKNCHISASAKFWAPWTVVLKDKVAIGDGATIYSMAVITIDDYSIVSQGAHLCTGTHDYEDFNFPLIASPITIGKHCWVCADAFIGPGVEIMNGIILGARSVTTRSIKDEWSIYTGHPVQKLKSRINKFF